VSVQTSPPRTADLLGRLGLPEPVAALAARTWDAIVVGAGHNGLACAAYLARAGRSVLVLEARERVGGACTLEEPWPGTRVSPCAYLLGLLHPRVIAELGLRERGLSWSLADAGMFVPFDDGTSIQLWDDPVRCLAEVARFSPRDVRGWSAMQDVKRRLRDALRPDGDGDVWLGRPPSREQIEARLDGDDEARNLLFSWSMVEYVERFLEDERLQAAYLGQGVIGTNASPHDAGTASIHFHHQSGRLGGEPGAWGYVRGGMGMVSFLLCDAARAAGAVVACGLPVARIEPGRGVELAGGQRIAARTVVSNADPRTTLALLGPHADARWKARALAVPMTGCTVKVNLLLGELPDFTACPGTDCAHHLGQINTTLGKAEWHEAYLRARAGGLPNRLWTELYIQSTHDPSVVPEHMHTMSVFAQYVPYEFAEGHWDTRRDEVGRLALVTVAQFAPNVPGAVEAISVLGPPDIERRVGLSGGHIFQGECLPPYMWDRRLAARTPMPGLFLCGACTHPGGGVIGVNGRNAAMEILAEPSS
jgi:phytoene dehydrogenase-like protein